MFAPLNRLRPETVQTLLIVGGFGILGTLFGVVLATGNFVLVGLAAGAMLSVVLFSLPAIAVWLILIGTLLVSSPIIFHTRIGQIDWAFSILGIFLLVCGAIRAGVDRDTSLRPAPTLTRLAVAYLLYGLLSIAWQPDGAVSALSGVKRHFQYIGLIFALAYIAFPKATIKSWLKFIVFVACVQVIYTLYQRYVVIPRWGFVALDAVVGTFEAEEAGRGLSSSLAFINVVVLGGLIIAWREKVLAGRAALLLLPIAAAPLLIAEVNVIFFSIPIMLGIAFSDVLRERPVTFIATFASGLLALGILGAIYLVWQQENAPAGQEPQSITQKIDELYSYNFGTQAYGSGDSVGLNRTTVYRFWLQHHDLDNPHQLVFGHGVGSLWPDPNRPSSVLARVGNYNVGLTTASLLLWEFGIFGFGLFMAILITGWFEALRLARVAPTGVDRTICRSLLVAMSISLLYVVYSDSLAWAASQQVPTFLTLGLIAYMSRRSGGWLPAAPKPKTEQWRNYRVPPVRQRQDPIQPDFGATAPLFPARHALAAGAAPQGHARQADASQTDQALRTARAPAPAQQGPDQTVSHQQQAPTQQTPTQRTPEAASDDVVTRPAGVTPADLDEDPPMFATDPETGPASRR